MIRNPHNKGFTLIELLVVIAIIGILAAVVLASLSSARAKGRDAAIKSNLDTVRKQAAIYYSAHGEYGPDDVTSSNCLTQTLDSVFLDPNVNAAVLAAGAAAGSGNVSRCAVADDGQTYAVAVKLVSPSENTWWCVDSAGNVTDLTGGELTGGTSPNNLPAFGSTNDMDCILP